MDASLDLTGFAYALGRAQAAWRFAGADLRRASALAAVSAAWETFRRDAGAGDVGPVHGTSPTAAQLLFSEDPRREPVLLWLADHGAPAIAEAATILTRMVGATRRFGAAEQALLDVARDALARPVAVPGSIRRMIAVGPHPDDPVLENIHIVAAAVDRLRGDAAFSESEGAEVHHALPGGTFSHFVPAEPGGCWALNLALLAQRALAAGSTPAPGLVSRALFRRDLEAEEIAGHLVDDAAAAWSGVYDRLSRLEPELARGHEALAYLSRNARTREAWLMVTALGACTRTQLARGLGLSRAGADIQARTLADAGLVTLASGGRIAWTAPRAIEAVPKPLDQGPLGEAASAMDADLAQVDRLLARTPQRPSLAATGVIEAGVRVPDAGTLNGSSAAVPSRKITLSKHWPPRRHSSP